MQLERDLAAGAYEHSRSEGKWANERSALALQLRRKDEDVELVTRCVARSSTRHVVLSRLRVWVVLCASQRSCMGMGVLVEPNVAVWGRASVGVVSAVWAVWAFLNLCVWAVWAV